MLKKVFKRTTLIEIIALLFVTLFLYTGIAKLMDYDIAREQIALTPLLAPVADIVVIALPVLEIITAIILFIPRTRVYGLWFSLGLMIAFIGYIIYILSYNDELPCTCGGVLEQLSWPGHLILNSSLILLVLLALYWSKKISFRFGRKKQALVHG